MKNTKLNISLLAAIIGCTFLLSSCEKSLDTKPEFAIEDTEALTNRDGINASITGIYSRLKGQVSYGRDMIALPEALGDNGLATNNSGRLFNEARNLAGAHFTGDTWANNYFAIGQINLTLEALPKIKETPAITTSELRGWEGQLLFLRALYYFDLVRIYSYIPGATVSGQERGGVPLVLKATNNVQEALKVLPSRAPIDDVYKRIYEDLDSAITRLPTSFGSSSQFTASRLGAQALYARVALYNKDYAKAKTMADLVISAFGSRLTNTSSLFAAYSGQSNPESLFEVRYANAAESLGVNVSLQTSFTSLSARRSTTTWGWGDLIISDDLLANLGYVFSTTTRILSNNTRPDTNDVRRTLYELGTGGRGAGIRPECTKFIAKNGTPGLDNVPVIRIAEMYLTRAEAFATTGSPVFDETAAKADLTLLKGSRYFNYTSIIKPTDDILAGSSLLEEILRQRRIELAFEGHRFFDLKRLGRNITKIQGNIAFNDFRILPSIPQREIDGNANLVQNFGY